MCAWVRMAWGRLNHGWRLLGPWKPGHHWIHPCIHHWCSPDLQPPPRSAMQAIITESCLRFNLFPERFIQPWLGHHMRSIVSATVVLVMAWLHEINKHSQHHNNAAMEIGDKTPRHCSSDIFHDDHCICSMAWFPCIMPDAIESTNWRTDSLWDQIHKWEFTCHTLNKLLNFDWTRRIAITTLMLLGPWILECSYLDTLEVQLTFHPYFWQYSNYKWVRNKIANLTPER